MKQILYKIPHSRVNHWSYSLLYWACIVAAFLILSTLIPLFLRPTNHRVGMVIFILFTSSIFVFVAVFIHGFKKNYIAGINIFSDEIEIWYPQRKKNERSFKIPFKDIEKLKFSSYIETQTYRSMEKKTLVLKLEVLYLDAQLKELKKVDIYNTIKNKEKFVAMPSFLSENKMLPQEKIIANLQENIT